MSLYTYYIIFYSLFPSKFKKKNLLSLLFYIILLGNLYYFIGLYVKIRTGMLDEL